MAVGFYFTPESFSKEQYDQVDRDLEAAGQREPKGRLHHCAFEAQNGLHVFDVWESEDDFNKFGETLMPILGKAGVDPGQPSVVPVYNTIAG